jgi:hypothetical protein
MIYHTFDGFHLTLYVKNNSLSSSGFISWKESSAILVPAGGTEHCWLVMNFLLTLDGVISHPTTRKVFLNEKQNIIFVILHSFKHIILSADQC